MDAQPDFDARIALALDDDELRQSFRGAMDFLRGKRRAMFNDDREFADLRRLGQQIKQEALDRQDELLAALKTQCNNNGIQVHPARDAEEACAIIDTLLAQAGAKQVIKGKSMATEEIGLNHYLEARNYECLESDMGEYIVQLAGETPSHIIMPAIHKNKRQIASLFAGNIPDTPYTEDVDALIGIGRRVLREKFLNADAGISGVNFAAADTGTLCLVENEGNGRMSTTAPDMHIAVMGIEKVIPRLSDLPPLLSLLTRSATGQMITTYVNLIHGPRKADEHDGPRTVHLVLLDNGRSRIARHPALRDTLRCIRCGACMNHCPVYARVGGHAYGTVYPGPIGQVVAPQLEGLDQRGELTEACSLNGACGEVCPVGIPLPDLIRKLREAKNAGDAIDPEQAPRGSGSQRKRSEALIWSAWAALYGYPMLYRRFTWLATRLRWLAPKRLAPWTNSRSMPRIASRSLQEQLSQRTRRPALAIHRRHPPASPVQADTGIWQPPRYERAQALQQFREQLEANHARVLHCDASHWQDALAQCPEAQQARNWLCSDTPLARDFCNWVASDQAGALAGSECRLMNSQTAPLKHTLFASVDAAITEARFGIAHTGSLVLIPGAGEGRLTSLVPPLHVVLVRESQVQNHLGAVIDHLAGAAGARPSNVLLVSGPSKTADIQQTLAYGAHGPKALIVILLKE